jgi:hypothetical protein
MTFPAGPEEPDDAPARAPATLFRAAGTPVVLDWTDDSHGAAAVDFARFLVNARDVAHALTVALALEVRTTVRTDVVRPSHPHVAPVIDLQVRATADAAAEAATEFLR